MYQVSSQALDPDWISLSIAKFSYNTSPHGTKTYTWNHITTRPDLSFVIRNVRSISADREQEARVVMKITAGAEEMVRRLQVKFRSHEDYHKAYTFLRDLGLPITNREISKPAPQLPPSPAPSNATSLMSAAAASLRPSSAIDLPAHYNSSPLKQEFKIPPRPESSVSEGKAQMNEMTRITRPFSTSFAPVASIPNSPLSRVNSFQQPATQASVLYPTQMEKETRHLSYPASQFSDHFKHDIQPKTSLYVDQLQNLQQNLPERAENTSQPFSASPFFTSIGSVPTVHGHEAYSGLTAYNPGDVGRPASTPGAQTTTSTLQLDHRPVSALSVPPRSELPFLNPAGKSKPRSSSQSNSTQVSRSTSVILPPSKSPNINSEQLSTPVKKPAPKKRVAQRKAPVAKPVDDVAKKIQLNADELVIAEPDAVADEPSPLAAKSAAQLTRPSSTPLGLVSKVAPRKRTATPAIRPPSSNKRPKMVDQSTQTDKPTSQHEDAEQEVPPSRTTPDTHLNRVCSPPEDYLQAIDGFVARHKSRPPPIELWQTPGWAEADDEHRQRLIDNFICENLENADFLKLCEDMDTSWRRIGLGM
ncbi:uncharacterized protein LY89DRAFT_722057 [Mollisia scopiformis]|uniref:Uncharacterized protein n=1 Tax=Mollisia scopiformis TaxID=149040 RepID=A0A194WXV8_MOLSC|nr:uncharacterized protein LY89DRAFT_722057 [Mollisia scopiformis]KUJ12432.1 hypothetical protein LY89DRAFT_722057 [Mollisia scopiformis]